MPGAAVTGRRDVMSTMGFQHKRGIRVAQNGLTCAHTHTSHHLTSPHTGTFNANPITCAAAITTLQLLEDGTLLAQAATRTDQLRQRINACIARLGVPATCFGESSIYHVSFEGV